MSAADETLWETTAGFDSSNISEFRYDKTTDTLQVDFLSGSTYEYYNVPPSTHRMFQAAASKGEFFNRHVKGRYPANQV